MRHADDLLDIERGETVVVFAPGRLMTDIEVLLDRARTVGAPTILVSDQLVDELAGDVTVALRARTVEASHTLTALRQQLGF